MSYIASKQLQYKCGDAAIDSYQYVHAGQNHVGRAGDLKEERGRVHQRGDGPSGKEIQRSGQRGEKDTHIEKIKKGEAKRCIYFRVNVPVEQQQQRQHGQIGGGDVGVLLETHEDNDDQCGWDDVVTLQKREKHMLQ